MINCPPNLCINIYFFINPHKNKKKDIKICVRLLSQVESLCIFLFFEVKKKKKKNQEGGFSILVENHDISYGHVSIMDLNARIVIKEYVEQQKLL